MTQKCPLCESSTKSVPKKSWTFGRYLVERYLCDECKEPFNVYYEDDKEAFTIPKRS